MRHIKNSRQGRLAAVAFTLVLAAMPVFATKLVTPQVTGKVTAISGNVSVAVEGKMYMIGAGTPASQSIANVHVGDQVGLFLDGPVTRSGTHVTGIQQVSKP